MDQQKQQHEIRLMRKYWQLAVGQEMPFQEACAEMEKLPIEDIQTIVRHLAKIDLTELVKLPLNLIQDQSPMSVLRGYMEFENLITLFHTNIRELLGVPQLKNHIPPVIVKHALQPQTNPSPISSELSNQKTSEREQKNKQSHSHNGASTKPKHNDQPKPDENNQNEGDKVISEDGLREIYAISSDDGDGGEMRQAVNEETQQSRHLYDGYLKSCDENIKTLRAHLHIQKMELDFVPLDILHGKIGNHNIYDLSLDELMDETKILLSNHEICNVANILKKNSRYLVAHLLWSKIKQTSIRGEERETQFSRYWASFDTKQFEKRTRQRYCKVGKWMMKTKWGIFLDQTLGHLLACVRDYLSMLKIPAFQEKSDELKLLIESFSSPNQLAPIAPDIEQLNNSNVPINSTTAMHTINIRIREPTPENLEAERDSSIQSDDENNAPMQKRKPEEEEVQNAERQSKKTKGENHPTSMAISSMMSHPSEPDQEAERDWETEGERALKQSKAK
jgi:hypothetical protein